MPGYVEKFVNRDAEEVARLELLDHYAERYIDSNVVDKGKEWQASSHIQEAQDKGERDLQKNDARF